MSQLAPYPLREMEFQEKMLKGVSRTFAFTIPQLPQPLRFIVSNAYLLCRILDTIEDEPALTIDQKREYSLAFLDILFEGVSPDAFVKELPALLSTKTIPAEHELIRNAGRVVNITRNLSPKQQSILQRHLKVMTRGMLYYQKHLPAFGLESLEELNRYCYYVAGVIGELLTDLFCDHSTQIANQYEALMQLSNPFGQGLQMTNIIKDLWEDFANGYCWLPRDIFSFHNFNLNDLTVGMKDKNFKEGLLQMIAISCKQLEHAVDYTLLIPKQEKGIRKFCFWNIGMAALTLQKIRQKPHFTAGDQVKISRNSVKLVALASSLSISNNAGLRSIFDLCAYNIPREVIPLRKPVH